MKQLAEQVRSRKVRIRPYESTDAGRVQAMSALLSRRSLYERFFAGTPCLPPMYLAALAKVDHQDREALIALTNEEITGGEIVVGIAEYIRHRKAPGRADIAVLVADGWQRCGIARRLVTELGVLAATRGIAEFGADTLVSNRPALAALASAWPDARPERDGTTATFTLPVRALLPRESARVQAVAQAARRSGLPAGTGAGMA